MTAHNNELRRGAAPADLKQMGPNASAIVQIVILAFLIYLVVRANAAAAKDSKATVGASAQGPNFAANSVPYTGSQKTLAVRGLTAGASSAPAAPAVAVTKKKALLFGLNYRGTSNALQGCIQDVLNLQALLVPKGFQVDICTDATAQRPTRAVMLQKLTAFFKGLTPNDSAVVWYSGHGALSGGQNVWVPLDFRSAGFINESTLRALLNSVPAGARVLIGSDSCYSGSFFDLKYDMEPVVSRLVSGGGSMAAAGPRNAADLKAAVRQGRVANTGANTEVQETHGIDRVVPTDDTEPVSADAVRSVARAGAQRIQYTLYDIRAFSGLSCDAVLISGCRDNQTAADAYEDAQVQGAMTWAFIKAAKVPSVTLGLLQDLMRVTLTSARPRPYSQVPQLSFGTPISPATSLAAFGL